MTPYNLASFNVVSNIVVQQSRATVLKTFSITSDILFPKPEYQAINEMGYVRPMTSSDVVTDSCAKPGWCGYFAADGDIVFWSKDFSEGVWDISGVRLRFQFYLH